MVGDTGTNDQHICAGPPGAQFQDPAQGDKPAWLPLAGTQRGYQVSAASEDLRVPVGQDLDGFGNGQRPVQAGRPGRCGVSALISALISGLIGGLMRDCHNHVTHPVGFPADDS